MCILNPHSGSADADAVQRAITALGEVTLRMTRQVGEAKRLASDAIAEGCQLVVAAGGDGTINEVVNGLADDFSRARLGIIPLGTGNDFARSINVPPNIDAVVELLVAGATQALDVVRMSSDKVRYFINVSAGGFSGLVDEKLTEETKRIWGPLAYLRSTAEALPDLSEYRTAVAFDDEEPLTIQAFNGVVANAQFVAGGNTDFANFVYRAETKLVSKRKSLARYVEGAASHVGHHYDPTRGPLKNAFIDIEARVFGGSPLKIAVRLESDDKPNSAGVVVDLVRLAQGARDQRCGGIIPEVCAFYMKSPPIEMDDLQALKRIQQQWAG